MKPVIYIRKYEENDKLAAINLLRLNTPKYFSPKEEEDFNYYLDNEKDLYYVLEFDRKIVGCGGITLQMKAQQGKLAGTSYIPNTRENRSDHSC